jgi:hypothetical protein
MIVSMSPKSYSDGCLNSTRSIRTAFLVGTGQRSPDREHAFNLGIFYEDSAAKRRWMLKFDDSVMLKQIDEVFVTVEPKGGSREPSGKRLLFASLRQEPNHP